MFSIYLQVLNYDRVRQALTTMASKAWYRGIIRDTAHETLEDWTEHVKSITHKLTGQLASSFKWEYDSHTYKGRVYINPRIVYKRSANKLAWPKLYGPYEEARGGSHAFFQRTLSERGSVALESGFKALVRGIPDA